MKSTYRGRFAPSPTGPLHQGSLVAAVASFLDARAHRGTWLIRIEDNDFDRNVPNAAEHIVTSLARCGMVSDEEIVYQSHRTSLYQDALNDLHTYLFECACSRKEIADSILISGQKNPLVYPGTCRNGLPEGKIARAIRMRVPDESEAMFSFVDRACGLQSQNLAIEVGDFVLRRADGFWAYQLAVVVDDAHQGITHIVRGTDLLDSTARQLYLQQCLHYPSPTYLHIPVVTNALGEKLSKQTGAIAFDHQVSDLLRQALIPAIQFLRLRLQAPPSSLNHFWELATAAWAQHHKLQP